MREIQSKREKKAVQERRIVKENASRKDRDHKNGLSTVCTHIKTVCNKDYFCFDCFVFKGGQTGDHMQCFPRINKVYLGGAPHNLIALKPACFVVGAYC